ncbi:exportin-T [Candida albicans P75010]|nr:exportin-T [Candida albicans P37039]KHC55498.1 exportin-T [Candida albicans P75010]
MEQQIHQAVEIALSGTADPTLKNQAFEFINHIKSTEEGYKACVDILIKSSNESINDGLKFFVYQVIDENIDKLSQEQVFTLNQELFKCLSSYINNNLQDPTHLRNKFAQILAKQFCQVYINIYPNFIKDLLELINVSEATSTNPNNLLAIDYYTRVLIGIHSEIGDKYITRSQEIHNRNNLLKDAIRTQDMQQMVTSWIQILTNPSFAHSEEILNNTLKIVGQYVSWMEISLFISPEFINTVFSFLQNSKLRNTTCETLIDIISKKMAPQNKLELLSLLNLTEFIGTLNLIEKNKNDDDDDDEDVEFMEFVAKLLNQIGQELLIVLENQSGLLEQVNAQLFKLWPAILGCLNHNYDDVSQNVFPFLQQFLTLSKKNPQLYTVDLMSTLLNKLILKMRFDDDDDGVSDEDTQAQFLDFRAKLKSFQDTIALLEPQLYLEAIPVIINESIFETNVDDVNWRKVELGLYQLNGFSDSIRNNVFQISRNEINQSKPYLIFQEFLIKLINSDLIMKINHPMIQSNFFELIVKHYNFLVSRESNFELIIKILQIFTSPLGLFNENEKVRIRSWYLFFRFIKLTKPKLDNEALIESIVVKMQPLLVIKAELPTKDEDDDIVENGNFNNQQYLFETMGLLISLIPNELSQLKSKLIDLIFQPIFNDLEKCISIPESQREPIVILQAHHSLQAIGTLVRGYDYESGLKFLPDVVAKIDNAAQVVLITLENFSSHEMIRDATRFAFARFIPIFKSDNDNNNKNNLIISQHLSKLITIIWSSSNLKISEYSDFLSFLGQIVHNFRTDDNIYQLLNNFITPLFQKIFQVLQNPVTEDENLRPDIIRDKNSLKRATLNFISSIVMNHLSSLLITESNKQELPEIIGKVFEYSYDLSDTTTSKLAIVQLTNFVNVFGGSGGKLDDKEDKYSENLPPIEGIDEFLINKVINLSFELPFQKQEFNLNDAQYRLIAQEIAILLKSFELKKHDEFIVVLSNYLLNMGLSQDLCNDFCLNLHNLDLKDFKKYFISFINKMKSGK